MTSLAEILSYLCRRDSIAKGIYEKSYHRNAGGSYGAVAMSTWKTFLSLAWRQHRGSLLDLVDTPPSLPEASDSQTAVDERLVRC